MVLVAGALVASSVALLDGPARGSGIIDTASVSMVGDSLTAGSTDTLADAYVAAGWDSAAIDAYGSRGIATKVSADPNTGLTAVDSIRRRSGDTDVWVIALGTNDAGLYASSEYDDLIRTMLDRVGDDHIVVWVNIYLPRSSTRQSAWNDALERVAAERPEQLLIYDWASGAAPHTGWGGGDGVHYTGTGYAHRAELIADAVTRLVDDVTASTTAHPVERSPVNVVTTSDGAGFRTLDPQRVTDTRLTVPIGATRVQTIDLSDVVADGAVAAAVNLTAIGDTSGFAVAWACDDPQPASSTLNYTAGRDVAVHAIVALSADRTMCVTASSTVDVIVDVFGDFSPDGSLRLQQAEQRRLLDTRDSGRAVPAGQVVHIETGRSRGDAVVLNLTVADVASAGYTTAWPCGDTPPATSVLNFDTEDEAISNVVEVAVGDGGDVCVMSTGAAHLVVDLTATYGDDPAGMTFHTVQPVRLLDTRTGTGGWLGRLSSEQTIDVGTDRPGVVVGTATALASTSGYIVVWSGEGTVPPTSTANTDPSRDVSAFAVVGQPDHSISFTSGTQRGTDVVFDAVGWFGDDV